MVNQKDFSTWLVKKIVINPEAGHKKLKLKPHNYVSEIHLTKIL